jgi:hypothetical protein
MKLTIRYLIIGLLIGWQLSWAEEISVRAAVDRNVINLDDVLTYTVTIEGTSDFPNVPAPESEDFIIISGPSQSSNIQIINGAMSASKQVQWRLAPTHAGQQSIPPVKIVYRRKVYQTEPISVTVNPAPQTAQPVPGSPAIPAPGAPVTTPAKDLFLKANVAKSTVYKGEELLVSFELYYQNVRTYSPQKLPDAKGFWMEQFPEDRTPIVENVVVNGVAYKKATIRRLALFPTTTGDLVIDPMVITCEVLVPRQRRHSMFDDFFNDSFFNDPFFNNTKTVEVRSVPVSVQVLELPVQGQPKNFNGAVGSFVIESRIDTLQTRQDQALTLRYTVSGSGNINTIQLPALNLPANVELFEPSVRRTINNKGKSIRGAIAYEYVLIPRSSGVLQIPPLPFAFFNPASRRYQTSTAAGFNVTVKPADEKSAAQGAGFRKEEISLLGSDIRFIVRDNSNWRRVGTSVLSSFWFWLINSLSLLLMVGSVVFRWWANKLATNSILARRWRAFNRAQGWIKAAQEQAGQSAAVFSACDRALSGFIADRLGLPTSGIGPKEIQRALLEQQVDPELIERVNQVLNELEQRRFLPGAVTESESQNLISEISVLIDRLIKVI